MIKSITKKKKVKDLNLVISGGNKRWLDSKVHELEEVLSEILKMEQLTDISLNANSRNNVFVIHYQNVNINVSDGGQL